MRDEKLDMVRGLSALAVALGHLRAFSFVDYGSVQSTGAPTKLLYFTTGLGHQAVMVFFVLSGYFVGGSVLGAFQKGRFSSFGYGLARLSRLWVVLLPALLATAALDAIGRGVDPGGYLGEFGARFNSGPSLGQPASDGLLTMFGNLAFLQTVTCPVYGTNGPLWSLANEFWYYLLFPMLVWGCWRLCVRRPAGSDLVRVVSGLASLALFFGVVWWLPRGLTDLGIVWLMGVAVWLLARLPAVRRLRDYPWLSLLAGLPFAATLVASKANSVFGSDYAIGIAFAFWMLFLLGPWKHERWYSRCGAGLSHISYTLYVVHFPFLFLLAAVLLKGQQLQPNTVGFAWFTGLALAMLAFATAMWWAFERNTDKVRRWIASWPVCQRFLAP